MTLIEITDPARKQQICEKVLRALPDWFGIEESTRQYIQDSATMPFFAAVEQNRPIAFLALHRHNLHTFEIHVMGVLPEHHRTGAGRALVARAAAYAAGCGARFLTVKTLAASHPDPGYALTRRFYEAEGFLPLEVFDDLWGEANPCLMLARVL